MATPAEAVAVFDCATYSTVVPVVGALSMQPLSWIVALAIPSCFALAMVMGANDVGNAFGTSVGSGVLSVRSACAIAAVFDFIGAIALGQGVASTIRKGIVDVHMFDNTPELLMFGNWCAVVGSACWVAIATVFNLPVSSTHAVIGAILGVDWFGVGKIAISWIASPILAGVIAATLFWTTRKFVMRQETSVAMARSRIYISIIIGFVIFLAVFFVMSDKAEKGTWQEWGFVLISLGIGVVVFLFLFFTPFGVDLLFRKFKPASVREAERQAARDAADNRPDSSSDAGSVRMSAPVQMDAAKEKSQLEAALMAESTAEFQLDVDDTDEPSNMEMFDETVEARFAAVQVLDAAYLSFCHGANDIANVAGPMATIWQIYDTGLTSEKANTPFWILILMGAGIVVGLFFFGYRVIMTMGKSMTKVTPSRGFSMELGTATSVLVASYIKIPVSTTQAAVGSVVAVGLVGGEKGKAVNWRLFSGIIASWVITLPVAGAISAGIYAGIRPLITALYPH